MKPDPVANQERQAKLDAALGYQEPAKRPKTPHQIRMERQAATRDRQKNHRLRPDTKRNLAATTELDGSKIAHAPGTCNLCGRPWNEGDSIARHDKRMVHAACKAVARLQPRRESTR